MRIKYIDNIRILCILLLIPYHTCMIYNNWGELFYVTEKPSELASQFTGIVWPWWMYLLFTVAGISSYYALQRRSAAAYAKERVSKLLLPLLAGLVFIIPVQSYIADIFYNGYSGGYFEHYKIFFTRFTYLTGQDGGFTPGHLWFILYLFVISMVLLPFMKQYQKSSKKLNSDRITVGKLLPLFLILLVCAPILEIGGKSLTEFATCFALGYFLLSDDRVQDKLEKNRVQLLCLFMAAYLLRFIICFTGYGDTLLWDIEQRMITWFGILAILGWGRRYLNSSNRLTDYFSNAAFPIYYFHQSILVIIGYFTLKTVHITWLQFLLITAVTFLLTLLTYELLRRIKPACILFGMKYQKKNISK